ncbi:MAG: response regulator [Rhodothermales bacterium]
MSTKKESAVPLATELLVATFTPDAKITFRNEAWQKLLGQEENVWQDLPAEDQHMVIKYLNEATAGTLVTNQILFANIENRDEPLPILLHFIPVAHNQEQEDGQLSSVTVTGEILAEPESWVLSQTQRNRVENVGKMTLGLIHEINNMLTNILGNFEVIEKSGISPDEGTELSSYLNTIRKAAHDGAAMTRSIKKYIRNEKSSAFELLDISSLLQDCISFTRPYWYNEPRRQGIQIEALLELSAVPQIFGAAVELRQVFINLITNAVQAMPRGGRLIFRTYVEDNDVVVSISDSGNGMSEKTKKRIFEPLFTTKGKQGTGLGLSLCYSIIQNHDARMIVDTAIGQGTTFMMRFRKEEIPEAKKVKTLKPTQNKLVQILAVDDEPGVRNVLANLLTLQGHSVKVAASGHEALDRLNESKVDIVFTDHGMPGMNGRQLAQAIKQATPNMPVVLITGDTDFEEKLEEVNAVIGKPFHLDDLQKVINELV